MGGLTRALAVWVALAVGAGPVRAGQRAVVLSLPSVYAEDREEVEEALDGLGIRDVNWVLPEDLVANTRLMTVSDRSADSDCGGPVELERWRTGVEGAHRRLEMLDVPGALADLAALEVDIPCLDAVPSRKDLFVYALVRADAQRLAAESAPPEARDLYDGELRYAMGMAASYGTDLPPPGWLDPGLARTLATLQTDYSEERSVPVVVWGEGRGLWIDGELASPGFRLMAPGRHLVQSAPGGIVVAAAQVVEVTEGRRYLVQVKQGALSVMAEDVEPAIRGVADGRAPAAFLPELLALLGGTNGDGLLAVRSDDGVQVWGRGGASLVLRHPRRTTTPVAGRDEAPDRDEPDPPEVPEARLLSLPRPRPADMRDVHRFRVGVGPAMQGSTLSGGHLEGLGGWTGGFQVSGRVTVWGPFAGAVIVSGVARGIPLPASYDENWLFRAMIPGRLGIRYGVPSSEVSVEGGLDLGVLYLGHFDRHDARIFGAAAGGISVPLSDHAAFGAEGFFGVGTGFIVGGGGVVVGYNP